MRTYAVLLLALAACGGKKPKAGAVVDGCDATHDPTPTAAYAQYLAEGGEPVEAPQLVIVLYDAKPTDQFDLMYDPGPHQPTTVLGTIYKCKLYRDDNKLAQTLVLDAGWASASPTARKALALAANARANGGALKTVPTNWQSAYTFAGPEAFDGPGGSVRIVVWRNHPKITSYADGSAEDVYVQEEWMFAADGSVTGPKKLASFNAGDRDAKPKAPTSPPPARGVPIEGCTGNGTGDLATAYAAYVKAGGRKLDGDVVNGAPKAALYLGNGDGERSELRDGCCTEVFPPVVATGYRCRLYIENRDLAQAMLIDRGWLTADPAKKLELARAIDGLVLPGPLDVPPPNWATGKKSFTPPAIKAEADGSVTFVAWHHDEKRTEWGGGKDVYSREQWSIGADGMTSAVKHLEVAELDPVPERGFGSAGTFNGASGSGSFGVGSAKQP